MIPFYKISCTTTVVHFFSFLKVMIVNILRKDRMYSFLLANIPHCSVLFPLGKYAQVTNNPENDGCINAVLLV